jgi:hypothetical protein
MNNQSCNYMIGAIFGLNIFQKKKKTILAYKKNKKGKLKNQLKKFSR